MILETKEKKTLQVSEVFPNFFAVLAETQNFLVIPSVGAFVEGWLLVLPKKNHLNFSEISEIEKEECKILLERIFHFYRKVYQSESVFFEHGPKFQQTVVGCGIDYAHLHIVPISHLKVKEIIQMEDKSRTWTRLEDIFNLPTHEEYVTFSNLKESWVSTLQAIPSQYFRRILSSVYKVDFNWKSQTYEKNIQRIIRVFREYWDEL